MASRFTPLYHRILVEKLVPPAKTMGGVLLPEMKQRVNAGKVLAVGEGKRNADGEIVPNSVKVGDTVLLSDFGGIEITLDGDKYWIYRNDQLLGVLTDEK